jgi:hypothetical protein
MIIAIPAAPQPFFSCLTNGTSNQTLGRSAAMAKPQRKSVGMIRTAQPNMELLSGQQR